MRSRIVLFISCFLFFVLLFVLQKIVFMALFWSKVMDGSIGDFFAVLYHGLPMDFSMAAYLSVLPALLTVASLWIGNKTLTKIFTAYFAIALSLIAIIGIADMVVYPHWGFHIDGSLVLYLQNPKEAFGSGTLLQLVVGFIATSLLIAILIVAYKYFIGKQLVKLTQCRRKIMPCLVLILMTVSLILPIRGGLSVSTMNIGTVYFSDDMFLNQAAVNPQFNMMYSLSKMEKFDDQYQFFSKEEASAIVDSLNYQPLCDSIPSLLKNNRPNIFLFILESYTSEAIKDSLVAPNMHRFAKEGVSFSNFYSNTFRTERGVISTLSGYPAQPTVAILKYPQKVQNLPSIPKSLQDGGYDVSFYYGGDINFANFNSYFTGTCRIKDITSDKDFSMKERMSKWGVPDGIVLDRVMEDLTKNPQNEPFCKTILTLSNHEPFDVPTRKFEDMRLNAVAYTDSCLGGFVDKLERSRMMDNSLIILLSDHGMLDFPYDEPIFGARHYKIPLIWFGGAIEKPRDIESFGSQNDLAATLLSQLKMRHDDFYFSKDMMNPLGNKFGFYSYVNGFSMIDSTGAAIFDNDKGEIVYRSGDGKMKEKAAKAFFQKMYMDLGSR